jgi:uncharacterized protein YxjI
MAELNGLIVNQFVEMAEVFTGFEARNRYSVKNTDGEEIYLAEEYQSNTLLRIYLRNFRPFEMAIRSDVSTIVFTISRPFRFYFHEISINDRDGKVIGQVKKEFALLERIYTIYDARGRQIFELHGPVFRPWTFFIKWRGNEIGKITKKWSGVAKEAFTVADNFGVLFPKNLPVEHKALLLGAVFLIDFVHFENRK